MKALDSAAHLVDQALFLKWVEIDAADFERNADARAGNFPLGFDVLLLLCLGSLVELYCLLECQFVELGNFVNVLECLLGLVGNLLFGQLFIVKLDNFLDGARTFAEVVADGDEFLDDYRGTRDGFHDDKLAAFDALGDGDFAFARQQRDRAHLAEIHADGIICFLERTWRQVEIAAAFFAMTVILGGGVVVAVVDGNLDRARRFGGRGVFVDFNAIAFKCGE